MVNFFFAVVPQDTEYLTIVIYHFISKQKKDLLTMREVMYKFKVSIFVLLCLNQYEKC